MVTTRRSWPPKVPSHDPSRPVAPGACCAIARLAENPAIPIAANNKAQVQAKPGLGARPSRVFFERITFMPGAIIAFLRCGRQYSIATAKLPTHRIEGVSINPAGQPGRVMRTLSRWLGFPSRCNPTNTWDGWRLRCRPDLGRAGLGD